MPLCIFIVATNEVRPETPARFGQDLADGGGELLGRLRAGHRIFLREHRSRHAGKYCCRKPRWPAAASRGDVPAVVALLHDDLYWTETEGFPYYSGTWRRPQDVVDKLLVPLVRDWDNFLCRRRRLQRRGRSRRLSREIFRGK